MASILRSVLGAVAIAMIGSAMLLAQSSAASVTDRAGNVTKITQVGVEVRARGQWEGEPPRRTEAGMCFIRLLKSYAPSLPAVEVKFSEARDITFFLGEPPCGLPRRETSLNVVMRDGRRFSVGGGFYEETAADGTATTRLPIDQWWLEGGSSFTGRVGISPVPAIVASEVVAIIGRAGNQSGQESSFRISICEVRTLRFE